MPRGDRTGPAGFGPMTGRGMGYCAGYPHPGYPAPAPPMGGGRFAVGRGFGWGRGWGRGRGFGRRQMAPTAAVPPAAYAPVPRRGYARGPIY